MTAIENLKRRAQRLRLSQKELAERAGVDQMSVYRLFHGVTDPRLSTVDKVTDAIEAAETEMRNALGSSEAAQ